MKYNFEKKRTIPNINLVVINSLCCRDPKWADVKLAQVKYLLSRLSKFKTLVSEKFDSKSSVLLSGDFNSVPGDKVLAQTLNFMFLPTFYISSLIAFTQ